MKITDQNLAQVSFHESSLVGISQKGSVVNLSLDDVCIADAQTAVQVTIEGVDAILRDGSPVDDLHMEKEDGEILTLRNEGAQLLLAVQWNDFAAKIQETVVYSLFGKKMELRINASVER